MKRFTDGCRACADSGRRVVGEAWRGALGTCESMRELLFLGPEDRKGYNLAVVSKARERGDVGHLSASECRYVIYKKKDGTRNHLMFSSNDSFLGTSARIILIR